MKVLKNFIDKFDKHKYNVGEDFPHIDSVVSEFKEERVNELTELGYIGVVSDDKKSDDESLQSEDETAETNADSEFPKHLGSGIYELSNGEEIKGKKAAINAEAQLKAGE